MRTLSLVSVCTQLSKHNDYGINRHYYLVPEHDSRIRAFPWSIDIWAISAEYKINQTLDSNLPLVPFYFRKKRTWRWKQFSGRGGINVPPCISQCSTKWNKWHLIHQILKRNQYTGSMSFKWSQNRNSVTVDLRDSGQFIQWWQWSFDSCLFLVVLFYSKIRNGNGKLP